MTVSIAAAAGWTKKMFNFILIFARNNKFMILKNVALFMMYEVMCKNQTKKYDFTEFGIIHSYCGTNKLGNNLQSFSQTPAFWSLKRMRDNPHRARGLNKKYGIHQLAGTW